MTEVQLSERRVALVIARWWLGCAGGVTLLGLLWPLLTTVDTALLPPRGVGAALAWWVFATRNVVLTVGATLVVSTVVALLSTTLATYGPRFAEGMLTRFAGLSGVLPSLLIVGLWRASEPEPGTLSLVLVLALLQGLSMAEALFVEGRALDQKGVGTAERPGVFQRPAFAFHLLPKLRSLIAGRVALVTASVTKIEAGLAFIGLGLSETPTWGGLLGVAARTHAVGWSSVLLALSCAVGLVLAVSVVTGRVPQADATGLAPR